MRRLLFAVVVAATGCCSAHLALAASPPRTATLIAAGDIASCDSNGDEQTAALVSRLNGTIAALGDLAYDNGTEQELRACYAPTWGRFVARTRAALGNHDYNTGTADAAIAALGLPPHGWYSYALGAWHVIVLNSNCVQAGGCGKGSPQWLWLKADLAATDARCTLAYWHHARFSSGMHGSDTATAPFWDLLARARADLVLQGHDHDYERFAPLKGIRSFVVGTGGKTLRPFGAVHPASEVRNADTWGVLRLTLRPTGYDWQFLPVAGSTFTDAGKARCR